MSLHADVAVAADDRAGLERLCRYVARPPLATERLTRLDDGRILYRMRRRWRDGTSHLVFEPQELLARLAALIPPPRAHQVRYFGSWLRVLAGATTWYRRWRSRQMPAVIRIRVHTDRNAHGPARGYRGPG
ncbi:MAG: transposase [Deltaproteobacteria bacterium]|nr:transposase [Deltaproteobacteria bacterium]